ncbi:N-formylglutamate amidohydrolase [Loktanella agnita]|uniref:N-formylglutamate amidohydrolase n=1 Tax=Loktanella agnita TaxID=287097 RepID=UPI003988A608
MQDLQETSQNNAVQVDNADGAGRVLILCEHASHHIPAMFGDLGLSDADKISHAAWDPGAFAMAQLISDALDAPLVSSQVSRLVYDCNRPPEAASAMPEQSELVTIPGNKGLSQAQRRARVDAYYAPFCIAVQDIIATRKPRALVTVHSFTPVYFGNARLTEIGILHDRDRRMADTMLTAATASKFTVERNQPYGPEDGVTHSLRLHGVQNGIPNVMLELRSDLIATPVQQRDMAEALLNLLHPALNELEATDAASD